MARKIMYLINPISGTRGKRSLREMIRQKTEERGIDFSILPTNAEGDYSFLASVIAGEGVTDIVICGGDGTVSAVMAALYEPAMRPEYETGARPRDETGVRSRGVGVGSGDVTGMRSGDAAQGSAVRGSAVRLGVIPMGSGNGLAFAAGIPKDPAKALDIVFAGKDSPIDGVLINGGFSCMLAGIGMDGKVAHEFAGQQRRGLRTYIRITMRNFFSARPYPFRLCVPGSAASGLGSMASGAGFATGTSKASGPEPTAGGSEASGQGFAAGASEASGPGLAAGSLASAEAGLVAGGPAPNAGVPNASAQRELNVEAFFISIANGNQFGNNFTIAPKASLSDGLLDIVIARKTGRLNFLWSVIRQVLGGYPVGPVPADRGRGAIIYFQTPSLVIENPAEAPLHIDGDPKSSARTFRIEVVPDAIRLIQP